MLAEDGSKVYTYGIEIAEELRKNSNIILCDELAEAVENSDNIIGPIPFSSNKKDINTPFSDKKISIEDVINGISNKNLIAGSIAPNVYELAKDKNAKIVDIMKKEEIAVLNTIATAEGTIEVVISNTDKIVHGSKILILGFGRVSKILAKKLSGLSADITCAVRKDEDMAWIRACGYRETNINLIGKNLAEYDIIINTVPSVILTEERLNYVRNDALLIDLASSPGGIDRKFAEDRKLKVIWALALPGKVAPVTTAEFIKETIYNVVYGTKVTG